MTARLFVLALFAAVAVHAQDAPPAADAVTAATPAAAPDAEVTICIDRAARQCWTASGRTSCQSAARPQAEVFDVMSARATAAATALRACWNTAVRTPRPLPPP